MSIFAYVYTPTGEVTQIVDVGVRVTQLYDGMVQGDYILFDITDRNDREDFKNLRFYKNGAFHARDPAPNHFYKWDVENEVWVFQSDYFLSELRKLRNQRIVLTDWTQLPDAPLTDAQKTEWQTYRQALRDVPLNNSNVTSLDEVVWPTEPTV